MVLSCPSPENYAAVAKQLHETAMQAEVRIHELEYQLRAAANRPTIVQTTTALRSGISSGSESFIGPTTSGVAFTTNFNNTVLASSEALGNNSDVFNALGDGIYEVGFSGNAIPSGAVDNNTYRIFKIQHYAVDPGSPGPLISGMSLANEASYVLFESNVGNGVDVTLVGEFRITRGDVILFTLQHANTSSTMNVAIGAIGWLHKLSDITLTAVL